MIEASHLHQVYGSFVALRDVSFSIPKGQIVGLVGPNGAGKTTTMKILTGYLAPSEGQALVAGHDVVEERLEAQRRVGYLPENAPIYTDMLVQDYLLYMADLRQVSPGDRLVRLAAVTEACGLWDVLTRPVGHLSKGYRQRVGLAQALIHDPEILILDEPTSGLDPTQILEIREMIRRMGREKTVILSTHILSEVESTCDRAIMIVAGRIHIDEDMESFRRGHTISLRILAPPPEVGDLLAQVPGVERVELLEGEEGSRQYRLHTDAREGLLEEIGKLAHEKDWILTELQREHRDLEDIFRELREKEEAVA